MFLRNIILVCKVESSLTKFMKKTDVFMQQWKIRFESECFAHCRHVKIHVMFCIRPQKCIPKQYFLRTSTVQYIFYSFRTIANFGRPIHQSNRSAMRDFYTCNFQRITIVDKFVWNCIRKLFIWAYFVRWLVKKIDEIGCKIETYFVFVKK